VSAWPIVLATVSETPAAKSRVAAPCLRPWNVIPPRQRYLNMPIMVSVRRRERSTALSLRLRPRARRETPLRALPCSTHQELCPRLTMVRSAGTAKFDGIHTGEISSTTPCAPQRISLRLLPRSPVQARPGSLRGHRWLR
jgi:hypothetical protein